MNHIDRPVFIEELVRNLRAHAAREEAVLYPWIERLGNGRSAAA